MGNIATSTDDWFAEYHAAKRRQADQIISKAKSIHTIIYAWHDHTFSFGNGWDIRDYVLPVLAVGDDEYAELAAVEEAVGYVEDKFEMPNGFDMYAVRYFCEIPRKYEIQSEVEINYTAHRAT